MPRLRQGPAARPRRLGVRISFDLVVRYVTFGSVKWIAAAFILMAWAIPPAAADDDPGSAAETAAKMNARGLEEYENLNFETAEKTLRAAIALCDENGLGKDLKARLTVDLGVVILASDPKRHEEAVAAFSAALAMAPDVKPVERIANPEVSAAFAEATKRAGAGGGVTGAATVVDEIAAAAARADPSETKKKAGHGADGEANAGDDKAASHGDAVESVSVGASGPAGAHDRFFLGLALGTGFGTSSGNGEVNSDVKAPGGLSASALAHVEPEIGYLVTPALLLSLQLRVQFISGTTPARDPSGTMCGSDHLCSAAKGAEAVFARGAWLFGQGAFRPFASGTLGVGEIRHVISLPGRGCGSDAMQPRPCVDTSLAGPVFVGAGGGFYYDLTPHFTVGAGAVALLGFGNSTFHVDLTGGVAVKL